MITPKSKLIVVGIFALIILVCASFGLFYSGEESGQTQKITMDTELEAKKLGGIVYRMPDDSAEILFESLLGVKLADYISYDNMPSMIAALKAGNIDAVWVADVTAKYLLKTDSELAEISVRNNNDKERLQFAFALRKEDTLLKDKLDAALANIKDRGKLDELIDTYVECDSYEEVFYEKDMKSEAKDKTLYVGVTGNVPPLDATDERGKPYGFSVALMDEISDLLGREVKFVVIDSETMFTQLMNGRVDMIFCYGTSTNHSTEIPAYIMTEGYYSMKNYSFIANR